MNAESQLPELVPAGAPGKNTAEELFFIARRDSNTLKFALFSGVQSAVFSTCTRLCAVTPVTFRNVFAPGRKTPYPGASPRTPVPPRPRQAPVQFPSQGSRPFWTSDSHGRGRAAVAFRTCLLPLTAVFPRRAHVAAGARTAFPLRTEDYPVVWVRHVRYPFSTDGRWVAPTSRRSCMRPLCVFSVLGRVPNRGTAGSCD